MAVAELGFEWFSSLQEGGVGGWDEAGGVISKFGGLPIEQSHVNKCET